MMILPPPQPKKADKKKESSGKKKSNSAEVDKTPKARICGNTCGWKSVLKCVKCYLKTENGCLKSQTKHPQSTVAIVF